MKITIFKRVRRKEDQRILRGQDEGAYWGSRNWETENLRWNKTERRRRKKTQGRRRVKVIRGRK